ncbi:MAG: SagB/ThcOx family dehydrogenase [Pseudomonadota bacterium]
MSDSALVSLPPPRLESSFSLEKALWERRSVRIFGRKPLILVEVGQLLWAAQGFTDRRGYRAAPSAGALFPLEVYMVVGEVEGLAAGVYKYLPAKHQLRKIEDGDQRPSISAAALGQGCIRNNAALLVFSAVFARTTSKYHERGVRYVFMEVGHAAQNVALQAVVLGLGTVMVGAFDAQAVGRILSVPAEEEVLYLIPVGGR